MEIKYPKGTIKKFNAEGLIEFDKDQLIDIRGKCLSVETRSGLDFRDVAFFLSSFYNWIIVLDSGGNYCLVPLKKTEG